MSSKSKELAGIVWYWCKSILVFNLGLLALAFALQAFSYFGARIGWWHLSTVASGYW